MIKRFILLLQDIEKDAGFDDKSLRQWCFFCPNGIRPRLFDPTLKEAEATEISKMSC